MKLWSSEYIFRHPWNTVTEACWRKYPNEMNPNVKAIDVVDRKITDDGRLVTTRIFGSHWNLPTLITTLFGMPEMCYAVEHIEVDPKVKKMTLKMINYTFLGLMAVEETVVYEPSISDPNITLMTQGAKISVTGVSFKDYFESVIVNSFSANSSNGRLALEQVIAKINLEDIIDTVNEGLSEMSNSFDRTMSMLDSEVEQFAKKVNFEFTQFVNKIDQELSQISISVTPTLEVASLSELSGGSSRLSSGSSMVDAVKQSGITAMSGVNL